MSVSSSIPQGNRIPDNVSTGDYTITVDGTYECGGTVQPIILRGSLGMTRGRHVLIRANNISEYVGATVVPPLGLKLYGTSREKVNYSGTTYDCIVVTLV